MVPTSMIFAPDNKYLEHTHTYVCMELNKIDKIILLFWGGRLTKHFITHDIYCPVYSPLKLNLLVHYDYEYFVLLMLFANNSPIANCNMIFQLYVIIILCKLEKQKNNKQKKPTYPSTK